MIATCTLHCITPPHLEITAGYSDYNDPKLKISFSLHECDIIERAMINDFQPTLNFPWTFGTPLMLIIH